MNTYNNYHIIRQVNDPNLINTISVPTVKKTQKDSLVKSISQMSITTQMNFQQNETSELVLTEIKNMRQESSLASKNVIKNFIKNFYKAVSKPTFQPNL